MVDKTVKLKVYISVSCILLSGICLLIGYSIIWLRENVNSTIPMGIAFILIILMFLSAIRRDYISFRKRFNNYV